MQRQSGIHIINVIIRRVEGVQRAAARFCKSDYHSDYTSSVSIMLESLVRKSSPKKTRSSIYDVLIIHGLVDLNIH